MKIEYQFFTFGACCFNQFGKGLIFLRLSCSFMVILMLSAFTQASDMVRKAPTMAVTVLVFNFREVPAKILSEAEHEAGRIFEHAGVSVTWQDCPIRTEPCRKAPSHIFILALMKGSTQNHLGDAVSGYAVPHDHLAVVYYDLLPPLPRGNRSQDERATILGCVIGHEFGHLLLGLHAHSLGGIMQAHWGIEQIEFALKGELSFLPEQVRTIQVTIKENREDEDKEGVVSVLTLR